MTKLNSSTRLKVKRDTFYLPDQEGGVYFRNNESSFRLKGDTIYKWIETLMPMLNGGRFLFDSLYCHSYFLNIFSNVLYKQQIERTIGGLVVSLWLKYHCKAKRKLF